MRLIMTFFAASTILLASCVSQKTLTNIGTAYESANKSAEDALATEVSGVKRTRRVGSIIAYLKNPALTVAENLNKGDVDGSFINFVCAGESDFVVTSAGLAYTSGYSSVIKAITSSPEDSISGYVDALGILRGQDKVLDPPPVPDGNILKACRDSVSQDIPPTGYTAVTAKKEAAFFAAIAAYQVAIDSIKAIVKDGLKLATEAEQRIVLKRFIKENQENYDKVLKNELSSTELSQAFERRRKVAVALPYYEFQLMMNLPLARNETEYVRRAIQINTDLADYDALRNREPPGLLANKFKDINQKLSDYADGKIGIGEFYAFLTEFQAEISNAKKDYDAAVKNFPK